MAPKYIFVSGGVVSSLGKGVAASSIGCLLESRGFQVTLQKCDPYLNVDPRSEEHTSELQSQSNLVCRLLLEKKKKTYPLHMATPPSRSTTVHPYPTK